MKKIVIIPAYKPDNELIQIVDKLYNNGIGIIVVDDGSGQEYKEIFDKISDKAEVIPIVCNSGKGGALKTGMHILMQSHPECEYFVTADADGQHKCEDIIRIFDELERGSEFVLTVRKFRKDMPFRSKVGNNLSRYIYSILNGHYFPDNQSGLRGFKAKNAEWLVKVDGNKYDYEMNVLYYADKQGIQITTMPIEALYIDNNSSSHFNPVKDTIKIYARLFYSARITFASWLIMETMLLFASIFIGYRVIHITIPTIGATGVIFNIILNKFVIFRGFRYRDFMRTIINTILHFAVYNTGVWLFKFLLPVVPLFISFNLFVIITIPAEYLIHKLLYISKYNDIVIKD